MSDLYQTSSIDSFERGKPALYQHYDRKYKQFVSILYIEDPDMPDRISGDKQWSVLSYLSAKLMPDSKLFEIIDTVAYPGLGSPNYAFSMMALHNMDFELCASRESVSNPAIVLWLRIPKSSGFERSNLPKKFISNEVEDWAADDILEEHGLSESEYDDIVAGYRNDIFLHPLNCGWQCKPDDYYHTLIDRHQIYSLSPDDKKELESNALDMFNLYYDNGGDLVDIFNDEPADVKRKKDFEQLVSAIEEINEPQSLNGSDYSY